VACEGGGVAHPTINFYFLNFFSRNKSFKKNQKIYLIGFQSAQDITTTAPEWSMVPNDGKTQNPKKYPLTDEECTKKSNRRFLYIFDQLLITTSLLRLLLLFLLRGRRKPTRQFLVGLIGFFFLL
jgi:hypothetical protein